jgi:hypothetical protein
MLMCNVFIMLGGQGCKERGYQHTSVAAPVPEPEENTRHGVCSTEAVQTIATETNPDLSADRILYQPRKQLRQGIRNQVGTVSHSRRESLKIFALHSRRFPPCPTSDEVEHIVFVRS